MILERNHQIPIKRQIYQNLRDKILQGGLASGEALPSTRDLSSQLHVSRNTVCEAYEMLMAEGFVVHRPGAPTRVATDLRVLSGHASHEEEPEKTHTTFRHNFKTGRPDLTAFPIYLWQRMMRKAMDELRIEDYDYAGPEGSLSLRTEIAAWLFRGRGMRVLPENIFITAGATQALHLIPALLSSSGKRIAIEDPCNPGLYETLHHAGSTLHPIPVDEYGIRPEFLEGGLYSAVYLTPSHQFPLGGILHAQRRVKLIRYAREENAYLIEDDYDSEFRYLGDPVSPLYTMDPERVIYVGTFSKVLFPAIRIGYVILPQSLQRRWCDLRLYTDVQSSPFEQAALAELLRTRKFDRHIGKMRRLYQERRAALLRALGDIFDEPWKVCGDAAGLHLTVQFTSRIFDASFLRHCRAQGLWISTVEYHSIVKGLHRDQLLIGYGHLTPEQIRDGIMCLKKCIETYASAKTSGDAD